MTDQELKTELAEEVSQLAREYGERGLSQEEIVDVLIWQTELAATRSNEGMPPKDLIQLDE